MRSFVFLGGLVLARCWPVWLSLFVPALRFAISLFIVILFLLCPPLSLVGVCPLLFSPPLLACPLVGPPFVLLCCLAFGRLPPPPTPSPRSFASWFPHHPDTEGARFLPGFLCLPFLTAASAASRASPLTAGAAAIVVVSYV